MSPSASLADAAMGVATNANNEPVYAMVGCVPTKIAPEERKPVDEDAMAYCAFTKSNISEAEVQRRYRMSGAGFLASVAGVAGFLAAGDKAPREARLLLVFPFATWISLFLSARRRICGISASLSWDPDGAGIRKIADPELAKAIWEKAKRTHFAQVVLSLAATYAFYKL